MCEGFLLRHDVREKADNEIGSYCYCDNAPVVRK
jgi:hypothetical protein